MLLLKSFEVLDKVVLYLECCMLLPLHLYWLRSEKALKVGPYRALEQILSCLQMILLFWLKGKEILIFLKKFLIIRVS